jgi:hypothetical protein
MKPAADRSSTRAHWSSDLPAYPAERFAGAGIVICAGGASMFTNAYVLLHLLRHTLGCTLPVEIWHLGPAELSPRMRNLLSELDATCVDGMAFESGLPPDTIDGWRLKALALVGSSFRNVLLLDADQTPVRCPADVFDWPEFRRTGAILWPDILDLDTKNPVWDLCGLEPAGRPSVETGQILIDKQRHWRGLQIALRLNIEADDVYRLIYGDKDTFLLGLLLAEEDFSIVPQRPAIDLGRCLYQHDFEGRVLFQHRTNAKWRYGGQQHILPGFQHMDACDAALSKLRSAWNGVVFTCPARGALAHAAEAELIEAQYLGFISPGEEPHELQLLPDGEIGAGRRADCMNWHCIEDGETVALILRDAFAAHWRLLAAGPGRWVGGNMLDKNIQAFAAAGSFGLARPAPARFGELWKQWPRPGHYLLSDDGQL